MHGLTGGVHAFYNVFIPSKIISHAFQVRMNPTFEQFWLRPLSRLRRVDWAIGVSLSISEDVRINFTSMLLSHHRQALRRLIHVRIEF